MAFSFTPYLLVLLLSAMVAAFLGAYAWRRRSSPTARPAAVLFLLICVWCIGNTLEIASVTLEDSVFWANVEYIAFVGIPVAWLILAVQYSGHGGSLRSWHLVLLLVIPAITLVLVWTNPYHGLMRSNVYLDTRGAFPVVGKTYGPWFWVHTAYSYALMLTAAGLLISGARGLSPAYRGQPLVLLACMIFPYAVNVLYVFVLSPRHTLDPTPVAFIVGGAILAWGLFHYRLFDLMPIAYRNVIAGMIDGVVVLDFQARVADLNPAAQRILFSHGPSVVGKPAVQAFEPWPSLAQLCASPGAGSGELIIARSDKPRYYDMQAAVVSEPRAGRVGRVIVLRDVTDRRLREEALRASEERFRVIFESAGLGISVYTGDGALLYANPAVQKILGYTEVELSRMAPADYADPDDAVRDQTLLQDLLAGRRDHYQMEKRYRRKNGTCATGLLTRTVVRDAAGRPIFVIGMLEDITERKQAEDTLARQGERMQALTRRLVTAQEDERRTIARELHDEAGGSLTALMLGLGQLHSRTDLPADAVARLSELSTMAEGILENLHRLAMNLRPASLDRLGLAPALGQYLATFEHRTGVEVHFEAAELGEARLPSEIESAVYRVVQEALTNVVKHSQATEVAVLLSRRPAQVRRPSSSETPAVSGGQGPIRSAVENVDWIVAIVEDNGVGFDPEEAVQSGRLGLLGMQERAEMLGGHLTIESSRGSATTLYLEIPCPAPC